MDLFVKATEYRDLPVHRIDIDPLQKLFVLVRSELNLDLKNIRQEQAKFFKQYPGYVKVIFFLHSFTWAFSYALFSPLLSWFFFFPFLQTELLIQAHLTRETSELSPNLQRDLRRVLELAPRLLEELMKVLNFFFPNK